MLSQLFVFHQSKNFTSDYEIPMPPTVPVNHYSDPEGQHNRTRILWCYPMLMYPERRPTQWVFMVYLGVLPVECVFLCDFPRVTMYFMRIGELLHETNCLEQGLALQTWVLRGFSL